MAISSEALKQLLIPLSDKEKYLNPPSHLNANQKFIWKIKNDFAWYAEKYLKIRDKSGKLVPFKLNEAQLIMERVERYCIENNILRRYIVLKARQMGISTYTEGKYYHNTSTSPLVNTMIITQEDKATQNLFNMSKLFYDALPPELKPMRKKCNEKALVFENPTNDISEKYQNPGLRSKYSVATANVTEAGRSSTLTNLHASEVAFWAKADITMTGLMQSIADQMNTSVIIESTANGVGGYFYDMWQQAMKGENDFIPIFLPWFTDSSYTRPFKDKHERKEFIKMVEHTYANDKGETVYTYYHNLIEAVGVSYEQLNWYWFTLRNKCQNDEDKMHQEYPSTPDEAFIATGRPKFNGRALTKYKKAVKKPIRTGYLEIGGGGVNFIDDPKGYVSIWQEPRANVFYCIGADVAEGLSNGDFSCGQVGDEEFNIVAKWHGHIDPDLFGQELVKLAHYFNKAYIGVENNNHGLTTLKSIQREEYWNIYYCKTYDKISDQLTQKMGWTTSPRTKPLMIDKLAEFVREMYLGLPDEMTIDEMFSYVIEDNGATNAQPGAYDDTVMSLAILLQLLLEGKGDNYIPEVVNEEVRRKLSINSDGIIDKLFEKEENKIECS